MRWKVAKYGDMKVQRKFAYFPKLMPSSEVIWFEFYYAVVRKRYTEWVECGLGVTAKEAEENYKTKY
jgi:hypothetical protein